MRADMRPSFETIEVERLDTEDMPSRMGRIRVADAMTMEMSGGRVEVLVSDGATRCAVKTRSSRKCFAALAASSPFSPALLLQQSGRSHRVSWMEPFQGRWRDGFAPTRQFAGDAAIIPRIARLSCCRRRSRLRDRDS